MPKRSRGEIWEADFTPVLSQYKAEIGKRQRPAIIIQTNILNHHGYNSTVIVPCTSDLEPNTEPFHVYIGKLGNMEEESDAVITMIRAIDNNRFMGDKPLAVIPTNLLRKIETCIKQIILMP